METAIAWNKLYEDRFRPPRWSLLDVGTTDWNDAAAQATVFFMDGADNRGLKMCVQKRQAVNIGFHINGTPESGYEEYYRLTGRLAPNFALYLHAKIDTKNPNQNLSDVPSVFDTFVGGDRYHVINSIGFAFDLDKQPDYKYFEMTTFPKHKHVEFQTHVTNMMRLIFRCAAEKKLPNVVLSYVGGSAFATKFKPNQAAYKDYFFEALRECILSRNKDRPTRIAFMGLGDEAHEMELKQQVAQLCKENRIETPESINIGRIPKAFQVAELNGFPREKTLYVNAWDPHSAVGNGNAGDPTLDGVFGRRSDMAFMSLPFINPAIRYTRVGYLYEQSVYAVKTFLRDAKRRLTSNIPGKRGQSPLPAPFQDFTRLETGDGGQNDCLAFALLETMVPGFREETDAVQNATANWFRRVYLPTIIDASQLEHGTYPDRLDSQGTLSTRVLEFLHKAWRVNFAVLAYDNYYHIYDVQPFHLIPHPSSTQNSYIFIGNKSQGHYEAVRPPFISHSDAVRLLERYQIVETCPNGFNVGDRVRLLPPLPTGMYTIKQTPKSKTKCDMLELVESPFQDMSYENYYTQYLVPYWSEQDRATYDIAKGVQYILASHAVKGDPLPELPSPSSLPAPSTAPVTSSQMNSRMRLTLPTIQHTPESAQTPEPSSLEPFPPNVPDAPLPNASTDSPTTVEFPNVQAQIPDASTDSPTEIPTVQAQNPDASTDSPTEFPTVPESSLSSDAPLESQPPAIHATSMKSLSLPGASSPRMGSSPYRLRLPTHLRKPTTLTSTSSLPHSSPQRELSPGLRKPLSTDYSSRSLSTLPGTASSVPLSVLSPSARSSQYSPGLRKPLTTDNLSMSSESTLPGTTSKPLSVLPASSPSPRSPQRELSRSLRNSSFNSSRSLSTLPRPTKSLSALPGSQRLRLPYRKPLPAHFRKPTTSAFSGSTMARSSAPFLSSNSFSIPAISPPGSPRFQANAHLSSASPPSPSRSLKSRFFSSPASSPRNSASPTSFFSSRPSSPRNSASPTSFLNPFRGTKVMPEPPVPMVIEGETLDKLVDQVRSKLDTHIPAGGITFDGNFKQQMKPLDPSVFYTLFENNILENLPKKMFGLFTQRTVPLPVLNRTLRTRPSRSRLS